MHLNSNPRLKTLVSLRQREGEAQWVDCFSNLSFLLNSKLTCEVWFYIWHTTSAAGSPSWWPPQPVVRHSSSPLSNSSGLMDLMVWIWTGSTLLLVEVLQRTPKGSRCSARWDWRLCFSFCPNPSQVWVSFFFPWCFMSPVHLWYCPTSEWLCVLIWLFFFFFRFLDILLFSLKVRNLMWFCWFPGAFRGLWSWGKRRQ